MTTQRLPLTNPSPVFGLALLWALAGIGIAGWHVWLQMNPQGMSCGPGLAAMLENFPLTDVLPIPKSPERADALLFVECKGKVAPLAARPGEPRLGFSPSGPTHPREKPLEHQEPPGGRDGRGAGVAGVHRSLYAAAVETNVKAAPVVDGCDNSRRLGISPRRKVSARCCADKSNNRKQSGPDDGKMLHFHPQTIKKSGVQYLSKNSLARKLYPSLAQLFWKLVAEIAR
jgi:hypothetical protein